MTTKMDKHDKIDKNNTKEKMTKNAKKKMTKVKSENDKNWQKIMNENEKN